MWRARNVTAGLDGLLAKRPGLRQWGQTLYAPNDQADLSWFEAFLDSALPGWVEDDSSSGLVTRVVSQGQLLVNSVPGASNETLTISRTGGPSGNDDASFRFVAQTVNLQEYTAADTNADTFHFRIAVSASAGKEFAVWSGGLYYKQASDSQYVLIDGTEDLGAGKWTAVEIRIDESANTTVYIDEVLVATIASSAIEATSLTLTNATVELAYEVDPDEQYAVRLVTPMYVDGLSYSVDRDGDGTVETEGPFLTQTIDAIRGWRALIGAGTLQRTLVCSAGEYIYHDGNLLGVWRPIQRRTYTRTEFTTFRKQIVWVDSNGIDLSKVYLWSGESTADPEALDEIPNCRFSVEHQTRLWVAGDRENPLRMYYSGDRQPNVWFAPGQNNISDRFDVQLDAGYIEVPSRDGDEITAVYGDYYGQLLVFTRQSVYRVTGSGASTYAVQSVSQNVGAENSQCITQVGNDVWFLSREGVHTVAASDKFGDLTKGFVSGPIQDLWGGDASAVEPINKTYIENGRMKYNPTLGLVYVAVPLTVDTTAQRIFVFNTTTEEWYGPWDIDSQGLELVEISSPVIEVMMHGGDSGQVLYTDELHKSDAGTAIESVIESAFLTGRGVNPQWVGLQKTWKRMRIFVLPRGDWDLKVFTRVDSGFYEEESAGDPNQNKDTNVYDVHVLTDEFRLGEDPDGRLHSREEMGYIEVRPERRGYAFAFKIVQDGGGEDFAIQGIEIDFIPHSHERD